MTGEFRKPAPEDSPRTAPDDETELASELESDGEIGRTFGPGNKLERNTGSGLTWTPFRERQVRQ
jgi:hypothetical protein